MNIIAFSLWGTNSKYNEGAMENVALAKKHYPDWEVLFFVEKLFCPVADQLRKNGAVVSRFPWEGIGRYYWRHCVPDVVWHDLDYYLVRDTDSRLGEREALAVKEWMDSGKTYHFMRDHPKHGNPWMQGMYGVKGYALRGITQRLRYVPDEYGGARTFFDAWFTAIPESQRMEHGGYNQDKFPNQRPFPTVRQGNRFVGEIFTDKNEPNGDWKDL